MTPMLEKIARAIGDRAGKTEYGPIIPEALLPDLARAVLLAMREVDEATVDVGHEDSPYVDWHDVSDIFTAMIDAILAQPSTPTDVTSA